MLGRFSAKVGPWTVTNGTALKDAPEIDQGYTGRSMPGQFRGNCLLDPQKLTSKNHPINPTQMYMCHILEYTWIWVCKPGLFGLKTGVRKRSSEGFRSLTALLVKGMALPVDGAPE